MKPRPKSTAPIGSVKRKIEMTRGIADLEAGWFKMKGKVRLLVPVSTKREENRVLFRRPTKNVRSTIHTHPENKAQTNVRTSFTSTLPSPQDFLVFF